MLARDVKKIALPGDTVAVPEEFLAGKNVYESVDAIKALLTGTVVRDISKREVRVESLASRKIPAVGDLVLGQIEAAQSSSANMKIYYLNGKKVEGGFSSLLFLRDSRAGRGVRRTQVKLGDLVRAKVVSTLNGIIQLSIDDAHTGVVFSLCSNCGRPLMRENGRAKCLECGNVEERKFSDDFGRETIEP